MRWKSFPWAGVISFFGLGSVVVWVRNMRIDQRFRGIVPDFRTHITFHPDASIRTSARCHCCAFSQQLMAALSKAKPSSTPYQLRACWISGCINMHRPPKPGKLLKGNDQQIVEPLNTYPVVMAFKYPLIPSPHRLLQQQRLGNGQHRLGIWSVGMTIDFPTRNILLQAFGTLKITPDT